MPDDLERLERKIEEGLEAVRELRKLDAERKKQERPRLRVIKGGLIWATVMAGVEWVRNYRRVASVLAMSGLTVTGAVIAEQPHSPGSDPPQVVKPPAAVSPSVPHPTRPEVTPTPTGPPRTSPPRTPIRSSAPVATPDPTHPTVKPKRTATRPPTKTAPPATTIKPPVDTLTEATAAVPSLAPTPTLTPGLATPSTRCTINLLEVKVCLPRG